jgi:hypothetical protein
MQPIKIQRRLRSFCEANQELENQTMAAAPSIVEYRLKNCLPLLASSMPPLGFQRVTHGINIPHKHAIYMN